MAAIKVLTITTDKWAGKADEIAAVVSGGGVILFPTETVYGVGSSADDRGVEKLASMKSRPPGKPFQVLISNKAVLKKWGTKICPAAEKLIAAYWPGPLTLALEVDPELVPASLAPRGTVGFRMPNHKLCLDLIRRAGGAITASSANLSGETVVRTCLEAVRSFGDELDAAIDAGPIDGSNPSTVVAIRNGVVTVLREGSIPKSEILSTAGVTDLTDD